MIGGDHARVVHGVLRGTKLWRVAKLTFLEVEYRPAKLDRRRDDVDAPLHSTPASPIACAPRTQPSDLRKRSLMLMGFAPGK